MPTPQDETTGRDVVAYTIHEFCRAHKISPAFYFEIKNAGLGPVEMKLGRRRMISVEAAAAWRRAREAA
jgi:hypothetical protein